MVDLRFRLNTPDVMHETIDAEVIVIHLVSGNYYSLRETAAQIWALVDDTGALSVEEIVDALTMRYASPRSEMESAVTRFVSELAEEGLVAGVETGDGARPDLAQQPNSVSELPFEPPRVEKYTDMQDLVLLDPVHQVDDTGWPRARPDAAQNA
jgi:hypothetical protein